MLREEPDDEVTVFDQISLLGTGVRQHNKRKGLNTFALCGAFFGTGLALAIPGPTLNYLKCNVGATLQSISYIFPARSVGYFFGSLVGGLLFDRFEHKSKALVSFGLLLAAATIVVAPWVSSLTVLCILLAVTSISMGFLDTGGNVILLRLWEKDSGPYMQSLHFALGVGACISPLVAAPFLSSTGLSCNVTQALPNNTIGVMEPMHKRAFIDTTTLSIYLSAASTTALISTELSNSTVDGMVNVTSYSNDSTTIISLSTTTAPTTTLATTLAMPKPGTGGVISGNTDPADANGQDMAKQLDNEMQKAPDKQPTTTTTTQSIITTVFNSTPLNSSAGFNISVVDFPENTTAMDDVSWNETDALFTEDIGANGYDETTDFIVDVTTNNDDESDVSTEDSILEMTKDFPNTPAGETSKINSTTKSTSTEATTTNIAAPTATVLTTTTLQPVITTTAEQATTVKKTTPTTTTKKATPTTTTKKATPTSKAKKTTPTMRVKKITPIMTAKNIKPATVLEVKPPTIPKNKQTKTQTKHVATTHIYPKPDTNSTEETDNRSILQKAGDLIMSISKVQFSYLVIAIVLLLFGFMFCCLPEDKSRLTKRQKSENDLYEVAETMMAPSAAYRVKLMVAVFIFFFLDVGTEVSYGQFLSTFSIHHNDFTERQGALLTSIYWGMFALARGMAIPISKCLSPNAMLISSIAVTVSSSVGLTLATSVGNSVGALWVLSGSLGVGLAAIFPTGVLWLEGYIKVTSKMAAVFVCASALGEMVIPSTVGFFIEKAGPLILMYTTLVCMIGSAVTFVFMRCIVSTTNNEYRKVGYSDSPSDSMRMQQFEFSDSDESDSESIFERNGKSKNGKLN